MARLGDIAKTLGVKPVGQIGAPAVLFITPDGILGPFRVSLHYEVSESNYDKHYHTWH